MFLRPEFVNGGVKRSGDPPSEQHARQHLAAFDLREMRAADTNLCGNVGLTLARPVSVVCDVRLSAHDGNIRQPEWLVKRPTTQLAGCGHSRCVATFHDETVRLTTARLAYG